MRVARLVNRVPPARGGKEIHVAELTKALADLGVDQQVFTRVGQEIDPRVELSRLGFPFQGSGRHNLLAFSLWGIGRVVTAHARSRFDAVHAHGDFVEATAAAIIAKACGIPALLTVHGDLGAIARQDALRRAAFGRMSTIWAVSESVAQSVRRSGVEAPVIVRPSAVRDAFFDVGQDERDGGIVFVGRLDPVKGLEHLIAAYDLVGEQLGVPWKVLAGGSGRYANQIIHAAQARRLMEWREERDPRRLSEELASARAFVLPSVDLDRMREGVPTALLEAVATRTPIVATNTGVLDVLLDDGRAGLLVEPGDSRGLADAIVATVRDPGAAQRRAEHALALGYARRWRDLASEVAQQYECVVGRGSRRQYARSP
jgi:glycosyltransferase involved in cell wall biosynthesis